MNMAWRDFQGVGVASGSNAIVPQFMAGDPDLAIAQICVSC
jgi:hypothetical protein